MKKSGILSLIALLLYACTTKNPEGFEIKGTLTNAKNQSVYLEELTPTAILVKDSVVADKNGEFTFSGKIPEAGFYRLRLAQNNFINLTLDTFDDVQITADAENLFYTYKIEGSENNLLLYQLNDYARKFSRGIDSLKGVFQSYQSTPKIDSVKQVLDNEYSRMVDDKINFTKSFIDKNLHSLVVLGAIEQLDPNNYLAYYAKVDKALVAAFPNSQYVKNFHTKVSQLTQLSSGSEAPEIVLKDPGDVPIALTSFRGKVVLIDFWASWCKPCRIENPNVVRLYNKYHNKGFEIYGVSLDRDKASWVKAIDDDGLIWIHVSDLGFWNSPVVRLYDIKSIPDTYLIDESGIIIARGLRGTELERKLEEILS